MKKNKKTTSQDIELDLLCDECIYCELVSYTRVVKELEGLDQNGLANYIKTILVGQFEYEEISHFLNRYNSDMSHPFTAICVNRSDEGVRHNYILDIGFKSYS